MSSSFWQNFTLINVAIQESLLEKLVDIEGGGCAILFQDYVGIGTGLITIEAPTEHLNH